MLGLVLPPASAFAGVDLLLCAEAGGALLEAGAAPRIGGGLPASWWQAASPPGLPAGALAYGVIPVDAEPEHIVARCAALRA